MQKLLQKLFGKKSALPPTPSQPVSSPPPANRPVSRAPSPPAQPRSNPVDDFRREEKAAMALTDFAEAVQTLRALYQKKMSAPGNISLNNLEGKKDACFYIKQHIDGTGGYSMNDLGPFRRSMDHSKSYSHEEFHRAKLEILEWAYERMLVIQPPRQAE